MNERNDQTYSSRSIEALDSQIIQCRDPAKKLLLFAKKAGRLARFSCLPEASLMVKELRAKNTEYDPQLSGWILLAEGLIEHFERLDNAKSKDKYNRAFLVGQMVNDHELASIAAAWMSHCELVSGQVKEAAEHIISAFHWSDETGSEARGRASMVIGDAFNWAGQTDQARNWYRSARGHAIRDGDIAMQNVMLFNGANFGVANLTLQDCFTPVPPNSLKRVEMDAASAINLNNALGIQSLSSLIPMMQAELLIMKSQWGEAINILSTHISSSEIEGQKRLLPKFLAQRAWCHANLGDSESSIKFARLSAGSVSDCKDLDDLTVLHARLSSVGRLIKDPAMEENNISIALEYERQFRSQQREILEILSNAITRL
jgi:hypothetical protein